MSLSPHLRKTRVLLALAAMALMASFGLAAAPSAHAAACSPALVFGATPITLDQSCFESGDGNMTAGTATGGTDWGSFVPAGSPAGTKLGAPYVSLDGTGATDNTFVAGKKEEDPANWAFNQSPSSPKDDLLAAAKADDPNTSDVFAYLAALRAGNTGSMDLSFEFNQDATGSLHVPTTYTDATGTHTTTTNMPGRQTGDVLVAFDTNGSVVTIGGCIWKGTATNGAWYLLPTSDGTTVPADLTAPSNGRIGTIALDSNNNPFSKACTPLDSATSPAALGAINTAPIAANDNFFTSDALLANQFAELSVDLTKALSNPAIAQPCFNFGAVWMRTRSSNQITSTPEDLVLPQPLHASSCTISGIKYNDVNGNGTKDAGDAALPGWKYELYKNVSGAWVDQNVSAVTGADGVYTFSDVGPGDYRVKELGYYTSPTDATGTFHAYATSSYVCTQPAETPAGGGNPRSCVSGTLTISADHLNRSQDFGNFLVNPDFTVAKTQRIHGSGASFTHDGAASPLLVHVGDTIDYRIAVTNTGNTPLSFAAVGAISDPVCDSAPTAVNGANASVNLATATLAAGATWTFSCSHVVLAGDSTVHNVFTATGSDSIGDVVGPKSDEVYASVLKPDFTVTKTQRIHGSGLSFTHDTQASPLLVHVGDTIDYKVLVANTGNTELSFAAVGAISDPVCDSAPTAVDGANASVNLATAKLQAGATWTFTCSHVVGASEPSDAVHNVFTATAKDDTNLTVGPHSDDVYASVLEPAFTVTKTQRIHGSGASFTHDTQANPLLVHVGDTIDYSIAVHNTGNTELSYAAVGAISDPVCDSAPTAVDGANASVNLATAKLQAGATWTFTCSHVVGASEPSDTVHNVFTATAKDDAGQTVGPHSDDVYASVLEPAFTVTKTQKIDGSAAGFTHDTQASPLATHVGNTIDYSIAVHNTGNTELSYAAVGAISDPVCDSAPTAVDGANASVNLATAKLQAGATWTFTCSHVVLASESGDQVVNTFTATAEDDAGQAVGPESDTVYADVYKPSTLLLKTGVDYVHHGDTITYSFRLTNNGNVPLTDVYVHDSKCPTDPHYQGTLAVGDSVTLTCDMPVPDHTAGEENPIHNVAQAFGTDPSGTTIASNESTADARILHPHIAVDKKVRVGSSGTYVDGPVTAWVGDTLQYQMVVTNDGGDTSVPTPLTVSLTDARCDAGTLSGPAGVTLGSSVLPSGQSWTFTCSHVVTAGDGTAYRNVVSVTGVDQLGGSRGTVTATDEADATIVHPTVTIDKTGPASATAGTLVPYTLVIRNTGDESFAAPLVVVTDDRCEAPPALASVNGDASPGTFDPNDSWTFTCSVQTAATDTAVHNTGFVDATDVGGHHAKAQDAADTTLIAVLPETLKTANARLRGPQGCIATKHASKVVVSGKRIASATFYVDGRRVKRLTKATGGKYTLKLSGRSLRYGSHRVKVVVTFTAGSTLKTKTLQMRINRCRPVVVPVFTG